MRTGFGALARSDSQGSFGWSVNCSNYDQAIALAISDCGTQDARWLLCQHHGYIAVAQNLQGCGWAADPNWATATQEAIAHCRRFGPSDCHVTLLIDTDRGRVQL
jgi:hypothetical protein